MIKVIALTMLFLIGCSSFQNDRDVVCEVECTNCEKVKHSCRGTNTESIHEVNY